MVKATDLKSFGFSLAGSNPAGDFLLKVPPPYINIIDGVLKTNIFSDKVERGGKLGKRLDISNLFDMSIVFGYNLSPLYAAGRPNNSLPHSKGTMRSFFSQTLLGSMVQQPKESELSVVLSHVEPDVMICNV